MPSGSAGTSLFVTGGPRVRLDITTPTWTNTTVDVHYELKFVPGSITPSTSSLSPFSIVVDGSTVSNGSFYPYYSSETLLASGTKTINRSATARTFVSSVSCTFNGVWNGVNGDTRNASLGLTIAGTDGSGSGSGGQEATIKIFFSSNGGSGAPSAIYKSPGQYVQIPTTTPTRSGYTFLGWATSPYATGAQYLPGSSYSDDVSVTLYAVWQANTYTITYNANGGSGAPSRQTKTHGTALYLSSTVPTRSGYTFKGWSTSATSAIISYSPGDRYSTNADLTLYAVWVEVSAELNISNITLDRCTSSGTLSETGTYAKVTLDYIARNGFDELYIAYKVLGSSDSYTIVKTITSGSTVGSIDTIVYGPFDIETNYEFYITIRDDTGSTANYTSSLATINYVMDFLSGGTGLTIGEAATQTGFHVMWPTTLHDDTEMTNLEASGNAVFNGTDSYFDASANTYMNLPRSVRLKGTEFLTTQSSNNNRPLITNHLGIANNTALQFANTQGTFHNVLKMNDSNILEFAWTNSALGGDIRKTLWEGTLNSGSTVNYISVPGNAKYNVFIITLASNSETSTKILATRSIKGSTNCRIVGMSGAPYSGTNESATYVGVFFQHRTSTQWTLLRAFSAVLNLNGLYQVTEQPVVCIEGLI